MGKKIYISPSSQSENVYAVGNTNEAAQCRKIAAALKEALERCGFTAYAGMGGTMYTRVAESNKLGVGLHTPIHTNAFDGKVAGLRIFISKKGGEAEKIAKAIDEYLAPITPGTSDGIQIKSLYEINDTSAICVYIEVGFHDNPTEAQWIIDHTEDIAEAICKGLCKHYGVTYLPPMGTGVKAFSDVPAKAWYADEVAYCAQQGLMEGYEDGSFWPDAPVTRAELAAVVARLHKALSK